VNHLLIWCVSWEYGKESLLHRKVFRASTLKRVEECGSLKKNKQIYFRRLVFYLK
jgi:hypothetical protein